MKNNNYLSVFIFIFLGFFALVTILPTFDSESGANPFDYARITDVDYKAVLVDEAGSNGKVVITEKLTYDIHAASKDNTFWELYRDLPEAYIDGVKVYYKVNSVKQILDNGSEIIYTESPKLYWEDEDYVDVAGGLGPGKWYHSEGPYDEYYRQYECLMFYIEDVYRDTLVFEIEYEMYNAALRYGDSSELYLSMFSDTAQYLNSYKGQILIPNKDMPSIGNYEAYTYGTNANSFEFEESDTLNPGYHTFKFELDEKDLKFKSYNNYIEFSLISFGEDKHKFTEFASNNRYSNTDVLEEFREAQKEYDNTPIHFRNMKLIGFVICAGISILVLYNTFNTDKNSKKKHVFYTPKETINHYKYIPSDLDPQFAAALVFSKEKKNVNVDDGYSSILLSLVRKKYIELVKINEAFDWNYHNIKIVVKYRPAHFVDLDNTVNPYNNVAATLGSTNMYARNTVNTINTVNTYRNHLNTTSSLMTPPGQSSITEHNFHTPINPSVPELHSMHAMEEVLDKVPYENYQENKNVYEKLSLSEEHYFNLILRHCRDFETPLSLFQARIESDYNYTDTFVTNMNNAILNIGINEGYLQKSDYKCIKNNLNSKASLYVVLAIVVLLLNIPIYFSRYDLLFGGFIILGISLLVSSRYLKKNAHKYILLTQFGEDEYVRWRGLYNYLNSGTLINESDIVDLATWEQYLIYATAFGIADKINNAISIKCPTINQSEILRNSYFRSRRFRSYNYRIRSSIRSASYTSRSGGYGGYGGGGRGGGGGGGGH